MDSVGTLGDVGMTILHKKLTAERRIEASSGAGNKFFRMVSLVEL